MWTFADGGEGVVILRCRGAFIGYITRSPNDWLVSFEIDNVRISMGALSSLLKEFEIWRKENIDATNSEF